MIFAVALALGAATDGPMTPSSKWVVDYRADMCLVSRQFGAKPNLTMFGLKPAVLMDGKSATIFLLTPNEGSRGFRHGSAAITLQPTGETRSFDYDSDVPKGDSLRVYEMMADADFMGHLGQATGLTIEAGKDSFSLATGKVQPVLDAVATCNDDLIRSWGADPDAKAEPLGNPGSWFNNADYPIAARRRNAQGRTVIVITVNAKGDPTACRVAITSGDPDLDSRTCELARQRGRYVSKEGGDRFAIFGIRWTLLNV
jgi:TonB family protein